MVPVGSTVTVSDGSALAGTAVAASGSSAVATAAPRARAGRGERVGIGNLLNVGPPLVPGARLRGRDRHPFGGESASTVVEPSGCCPRVVTLLVRPFRCVRDGSMVLFTGTRT